MDHSDNFDNVGNKGVLFLPYWILNFQIIRPCPWFLDSISEWVKYLYSSLKIIILNKLMLQKIMSLKIRMKTKIATLSSFCHRYMCSEVSNSSVISLWTVDCFSPVENENLKMSTLVILVFGLLGY